MSGMFTESKSKSESESESKSLRPQEITVNQRLVNIKGELSTIDNEKLPFMQSYNDEYRRLESKKEALQKEKRQLEVAVDAGNGEQPVSACLQEEEASSLCRIL